MTTVATIIQDSLCQRGVLADDVAPSTAQLNTGVRFLQRMLDSWGIDTQMVYVIATESFTTTAGTAEYLTSLFTSGNGRPNSVDSMTVVLSNVTYPIDMISNQAYNDIVYKSTQSIPNVCYYDGNFPDATFHFYPTPNAAFTVYVDCLRPLTTSALTSATVLSLPAGYEKAIVDNLAIYQNYGNPPTPQMIKDANESRAVIKRTNYRPLVMDAGINSGYSVSNDFPYRGF